MTSGPPTGVPQPGSSEPWRAPQQWAPPTVPPQPSGGPHWPAPDPTTAASWPAPAGAPVLSAGPRPRRRIPTAVKALVIGGLVMALTIGLVWAGGGFEPRQQVTDMQIGEVLDLGPAEVTVDQAVRYDLLDAPKVEVYGSCRLSEESASGVRDFSIKDAAFVGVRDPSGEIYLSTNPSIALGTHDATDFFGRDLLSPGIPAVPCVFRFDMPSDTQFSEEITFIIWKLEFTEQGNVKNDSEASKVWATGSDGYRVKMPVTLVRR